MKILIIHTFGLGDMIMLTPALQELIEIYPDIKIDFLIVQKISAEPIKRFSNINKIYFINFKLLNLMKVIFQLRKENYDKIITTSGTNPLKVAFFYLFLKGKEKKAEYKNSYQKIFFSKSVKYVENIHRVENNNFLIIDKQIVKYSIQFFGIEKNLQSSDKKILVGIHAGSNPKFKIKRWKKEYFVELIDLLHKYFNHLEFIIFSGPNEIKESEYISYNTKSKIIKNRSLSEIAKLISTCDIFINTDSGLGHIAGCFNVETFTIFGPAKDYKSKVYNKNTHIIKLNIECQPCYGTSRIRTCIDFKCLNNLTPTIIFRELISNSKVLKNAK